jgi:hypothetical protein
MPKVFTRGKIYWYRLEKETQGRMNCTPDALATLCRKFARGGGNDPER